PRRRSGGVDARAACGRPVARRRSYGDTLRPPMPVLILLLAYLIGSIPFSYVVARLRGVDVRRVGSGNVGATNVMRSAGWKAGLAAFALDFAKGSAATVLARHLALDHRPDE